MAAALKARLTAAAVVLREHESLPSFPTVSRFQCRAFIDELSSAGKLLAAAQLADIATMTYAVPWAEDDRRAASLSLESLSDKSISLVRKRRTSQKYLCFLDYLPQLTIDILNDATVVNTSKLEVVSEAITKLYCVNPCEFTVKMATSVYLLAAFGLREAVAMSPSDKHRAQLSMKAALKRKSRKIEVSDDLYVTELFPVTELERKHPALYDAIASNRGSGLNAVEVAKVYDSFQCRLNRTSVSVSTTLACQGGNNGEHGMQQHTMLDCMTHLMQLMNQQRRDAEPRDIPIKYITPSSTEPKSSTGSEERLRFVMGLPRRLEPTDAGCLRRCQTVNVGDDSLPAEPPSTEPPAAASVVLAVPPAAASVVKTPFAIQVADNPEAEPVKSEDVPPVVEVSLAIPEKASRAESDGKSSSLKLLAAMMTTDKKKKTAASMGSPLPSGDRAAGAADGRGSPPVTRKRLNCKTAVNAVETPNKIQKPCEKGTPFLQMGESHAQPVGSIPNGLLMPISYGVNLMVLAPDIPCNFNSMKTIVHAISVV